MEPVPVTLSPDAVTLGGDRTEPAGGPIDVSGLLATDDRSRMVGGAQPNGWFAGPPGDPDRYELLGPGLSGGEGDIWRARYRGDLTSPLQVAVKRLRRPANMGDDWPTPADLRRWEDLRALLLIMRIDHMVSVLDVFVGPPPHLQHAPLPVPGPRPLVTPYVVMEWVPGPTLADELAGTPATAKTLTTRLRYVEQVAAALGALHSRTASAGNPSLHRDVKPPNCILAPSRGVVLVDIGTMRRVDDGRDLSGRHSPAYTAPEVLADPMAARDPASDLYSLGALAWFCVVGENPPHARDPFAPDRARRRAEIVARDAEVRDPRAFADHLTRLLAHDPADRPADPRAWAGQLRALATARRARPSVFLAALVLIPLLSIGLILAPLLFTRQTPQLTDTPRPASTSSIIGGPQTAGDPQGRPPRPSFGVAVTPWPGKPSTSKEAAFVTPRNGAGIGRCPGISGTAHLPPGRTLLFSVENLSAGDGVRHITPIRGWQHPASLSRWKLRPPVGLPFDPLGMQYRLEVIVVPLDPLKERGPFSVPDNSHVGASLFVSRESQSEQGC
ncbi:serine/threonine protein kinase [Kineosporia mesophila]|uniref:serine/threonine protein kinase n=1 Tax=Kineosporia mesophila TaxID=566012 RepID=UPI0031E715A9